MKGQRCSRCSQPARSLLILACVHDICTSCVGEHRDSIRNVNGQFFFRCVVCKIHTQLDQDTVVEFQRMGHRIVNSNSQEQRLASPFQAREIPAEEISSRLQLKQRRAFEEEMPSRTVGQPAGGRAFSTKSKLFEMDATSSPARNRSFLESELVQQHERSCREHEEELNYFCLDCSSKQQQGVTRHCLICSECVIRGSHQGHNAKTLKHAYPLLKSRCDNLVTSLKEKLGLSQSAKTNLEVELKSVEQHKQELRLRLQSTFKRLSDALEAVFAELGKQVEDWASAELHSLHDELKVVEKMQARTVQRIEFLNEKMGRAKEYDFVEGFCAFYSEGLELLEEYGEKGALLAKEESKVGRQIDCALDCEPVLEKIRELVKGVKVGGRHRSPSPPGSIAQQHQPQQPNEVMLGDSGRKREEIFRSALPVDYRRSQPLLLPLQLV